MTTTVALAGVGSFVVSLSQAIMGTGYYSADSPQLQPAMESLYESFMGTVGPGGELHFFIAGESAELSICTEIPGQPTVQFDEIMPDDIAGINSDRFVNFLQRKGLSSLTINSTIGSEEFNRLVGLMGAAPQAEPEHGSPQDLFLADLKEHQILNISFILEDDLIVSPRKVSWRAMLALSKLRKDLKTLSTPGASDTLKYQKKTREYLHDVSRSLIEPKHLYSFLMNLDLAMSDAGGDESLEDELLDSIDDRLFIEMTSLLLSDATGKDARYKDALPPEKFTRLLIKTSDRLIGIDGRQADEKLKDVFEAGLIPMDKVSTPVRERITIIRLVKSFLDYSQGYLEHLDSGTNVDEYARSAMPLAMIVPFLLDGGSYPEAVSIVTLLITHSREGTPRARIALKAIKEISESGSMHKAAKAFLDESKENRTEIGKFFKLLGAESIVTLLEIINRTSDIWRIKHVSELLLEMGPDSVTALVTSLKTGKVSKHAIATVIRVLGGLDHEKLKEQAAAAVEQMINNKNVDIRKEALHALSLLSPIGKFEIFRKACLDPVSVIKKEAVRGLGMAGDPAALELLIDIIENAPTQSVDDKWDVASSAVLGLGYLYESAPDSQAKTTEYLLKLAKKGYPGGKLKRMLKTSSVFPPTVMTSLVYSLGRMGGDEAARALKEIAKSRDETVSRRASVELERLSRAQ